jgi:hypothetical protein
VIVKLLGYAPDADPSIVGILTGASGVVPTVRGLKGAPSPASAGMATLAGTCQGAALLTKIDGTYRLIAGTGAKLYEAGSSTWSDVSRASTYTAGSTARWRFAQQGNVSFAANSADTIQASVSSGAFSCVAGAPVAAILETVGKFVFALNTSADARKIQWSALNDYTSWSASVSTQAGNDTLTQTPGGITAGRAFGNTIVVYKKNSMYLGVNVGPPNIWEFNLIPGSAGALSQEVVLNIGTPENPKHLIMGEDDFYIYDGSKPIPIGENRIKQEVFGTLLQSRYYACTALHDKKNSLVYFYWPSRDSQLPDKCRVYNYKVNQWGVDDRQIEATTDFVAAALTYDGLGALYATYDSFPSLTYDLAFLGATQLSPAIFDTAHTLNKLTAAAGSTSLTTGDYGDPSQFTTLQRVVPQFIQSPTTARMTNYYKTRTGNALATGALTDLSNGAFDALQDARWHRIQLDMTGDWEMSGFTPEWVEGGLE